MTRLNEILQLVGAACVVVGASMIAAWLAWAVAGAGIIAFAVIRDLSEESDGTNDDRALR